MDEPTPFNRAFASVYPTRRNVDLSRERGLLGLMVKSVFYSRSSERLLCRALVIHSNAIDAPRYSTVNMTIANISPVVGYDLSLACDEPDDWHSIENSWRRDFVLEPVTMTVTHQDIKRTVEAAVFPLRSVARAAAYMRNVKCALSFGDFCPDRGFYMSREGNTPALCCDVMFGRTYFVDSTKNLFELTPSDLVYDKVKSEEHARAFDAQHLPHFYKAACLDVETVFHDSYRDPELQSKSFGYKFPYCTENTVADLLSYREKLVAVLNEHKKTRSKQTKNVTIPAPTSDMPGKQHELTCVSIVVMNTHLAKSEKKPHRKILTVLYNKAKANGVYPIRDAEVAKGVAVDAKRVKFYACDSEFDLLEKTIRFLHAHSIELLYVYNAEFDVRVLDQRVHFYADGAVHGGGKLDAVRRAKLLESWHGLFLRRAFATDDVPLLQFENVKYLDMYAAMIKDVGSMLRGGKPLDDRTTWTLSSRIETFNKDKAKLGHFKMNGCGMNVIDLYRVAGTKDVKYACTSMKLNDVAPFVIARHRSLNKKRDKDPRKTRKLADVSYDRMDAMMSLGGTSLFAMLVYNLVDSQLCARLAKALNPVSALFHRCVVTLNVDAIVHGRYDTFGGFVQSIHSVQMPQLKYALDTLRAWAGPVGAKCNERARWDFAAEANRHEGWKGGAVCDPLTGLHFAGPGMGLELSFDFASMYPSIMCALNISPETTVPWPPSRFPHDVQGWVCYHWEAEGFQYASLILKYDPATAKFERSASVFASSVEHYLNQRARFKEKLKRSDVTDSERAYYKLQEVECKVLANSFYGTAPHPCGPLISGHGRRQISVVNDCVSTFYKRECPVIYGDTDSVMVSVGYGPRDPVENDVPSDYRGRVGSSGEEAEEESHALDEFAQRARAAIRDKFKSASGPVPGFLRYVHSSLVEDALKRMYVIGPGNKHERLVRDPEGRSTAQGYPVYVGRTPRNELVDVTGPFVAERRVKLEYENSCSVYCHVAKKTYLALTHVADAQNEIASIAVKVRGLSAFKCMRSPCDSAVTQTFVACVLRGDCVKLEPSEPSCFSTLPWHKLEEGDLVLYFTNEPTFDARGAWLGSVEHDVAVHRVTSVTKRELDAGYCAVSTGLIATCGSDDDDAAVRVRTLYKNETFCLNHMISRKHGVLRDALVEKASELIASKMGAGLFPWSTLIKSAKNKHFAKQTLDRLKVGDASVKTTFVEICKTWLQRITGLPVKPVECYEFHKCNPCEATVYRYPLALRATSGCVTAMFGGTMICENKRSTLDESVTAERSESNGLVDHPYQPGNKCYADSKVLLAHRADATLVNRAGKLVAHCIIDMCLPRHMYSSTTTTTSTDSTAALHVCERNLLRVVGSIRERLKKANAAFTAFMNTCPEHMLPTCGPDDMRAIAHNKKVTTRLPGEKIEACTAVVVRDMRLEPELAYDSAVRVLSDAIRELRSTGAVTLLRGRHDVQKDGDGDGGRVTITVPHKILRDAGVECSGDERLSVSKSETYERSVVDFAGLLYRASLMLHIRQPDAFAFPARTDTPGSTLRIVPYSCADPEFMNDWIVHFQKRQWLRAKKPTLGKRTRAANDKEVAFHCAGCKEFYRELYISNVRARDLVRTLYGQDDKKRLYGRCTSESAWVL